MSEIIKSIKTIQNGTTVDFVSDSDGKLVQTTAYTYKESTDDIEEFESIARCYTIFWT